MTPDDHSGSCWPMTQTPMTAIANLRAAQEIDASIRKAAQDLPREEARTPASPEEVRDYLDRTMTAWEAAKAAIDGPKSSTKPAPAHKLGPGCSIG